jgi:hypothetical protein
MVRKDGVCVSSCSSEIDSLDEAGSGVRTVRIPATRRHLASSLIVAGFSILLASCATLQVPVSEPTFSRQHFLSATQDGIRIGARPIVDEDEYLKLFDDFLPQIGIVALWVEVNNTRAEAIDLRPGNWYLRTGNRRYHASNVQDIFARYYRGRGIRMYAVGTDRTARRNMEKVAFPFGRIEPNLTRHGLLFFEIDPALISVWDRGATVGVTDIRLNRGLKISFEIKISHAHP